jgi:hypothetical protein
MQQVPRTFVLVVLLTIQENLQRLRRHIFDRQYPIAIAFNRTADEEVYHSFIVARFIYVSTVRQTESVVRAVTTYVKRKALSTLHLNAADVVELFSYQIVVGVVSEGERDAPAALHQLLRY